MDVQPHINVLDQVFEIGEHLETGFRMVGGQQLVIDAQGDIREVLPKIAMKSLRNRSINECVRYDVSKLLLIFEGFQ